MAHITADRVRQLSISTGTGPFTVSGTFSGFRTFSSVLNVTDTFWYAIASFPGSQWEVGLGTYSAANTITRTTVLASSNAGAPVEFTAGDKEVFITAAASKFLQQDAAGSYGNFTAGTITAALTGAASSNVLKTGDTMTGSFLTNIGGSATSTTKHIALTNGSNYDLFMLPRAAAGSYNTLTQAGDAIIGFSGGSIDSGALLIGPWSASGKGIRIDSSGIISIGATSVNPAVTNTQTLGTSSAVWSNVYATTFTGNSSTTSKILSPDTRAVTTTPETLTSPGVVFDFKANTSNALSDGGTYHGLMTYRPYGSLTDWTGGNSHQIGFTNNNNIWHRAGNSTTWGTWQKIYDTADAATANTASTLVLRDASGNFSAGTITAALTGNATGFTSTTQNSQFNSIGVGVAASSTAGQINATGVIQANKGIKSSDSAEPTYKINWDSGAALGGTWWKIVTVALAAATQYSTQGFKITLTDAAANHATQGSADSAAEYVYYVACVRSEATTIDTPDLCVVRGPSTHIRAVKTSTGNYEIQVQPLTQYREYIIEIETYASNASSLHTITFSNGTVAGSAGIATYSASAGTGSLWVQKLKSVNGISLSEPGSTGDRLLLSTSTSGAIINQNHASSIFLQNQGTNRLVITSAGEVGIGTAATTAQSLGIGRSITGGATAIALMNNGTVQTDVAAAWIFRSSPSTVASAFTLPSLAHFSVLPGTLGASSILTTEYGALFQNTMVNATTTYGLYSNIPAQVVGGTAVATATSISQTGTTVTVNATAHGFVTGQYVTVAATANVTALTAGAWVTVLTLGDTNFTAIGGTNTVGASFTASGAGTGTGTVTLNAQGSGKNITFVDANTFTYTTTSATYTAITLLTGVITPAARWNIYANGSAPNYFAGSVGIGTLSIANVNLRLGKTIVGSGGTSGWSVFNGGTVQADVTNAAYYHYTNAVTAGAVTNIYHHITSQGTLGGAVTNQYGFNSGASLIGATNNYAFIAENTAAVTTGKVAYGFFGNINTQTGGGSTWNFYANGTAPNYFSDIVGIGANPVGSTAKLFLGGTLTGGATRISVRSQHTFQSDVTLAVGFSSAPITQATTYTLANLQHFRVDDVSLGANSVVTNQYGVYVAPLVNASGNYAFLADNSAAVAATKTSYGFYSNNNTATGGGTTWNFYANGTASNYFAGSVGIGTTTPSTYGKFVSQNAVNGTTVVASFNNISNASANTVVAVDLWADQAQSRISSNRDAGGTSSSLIFSTANASTLTEKMRIDNAGNVTPGVTNTQTLGAVGDVWSTVHANTVSAIFHESVNTISTNYTITAGSNAMTPGPITIASGFTVTVPSGSVWTIV